MQKGHRRATVEVVADGVVSDAVVVFDRSERIIQANTSACALLDLARYSERTSTAVCECLHLSTLQDPQREDPGGEQTVVRRILNGEDFTWDHVLDAVLYTRTGREVPVSIAGEPLREPGGEVVGGVLALRERQRHRRAARRTQAAEQSTPDMVSHLTTIAAGAADTTSQDEFFAMAAHELRNATAALQGYASMLTERTVHHRMRSKLAKWQSEAIEALAQIAGQVTELADDVLDITRIHTGKLELHCRAVDLVALTQRVVQRLQATTCRHHITFSAPAASSMAHIDMRRIEQVLTNLIGNAIKYSPDGGEIRVIVHENRMCGTVTIAVCDHGIGIPQNQSDQVFKRFGRTDNARRLGIDGAGLGLYVSRELVERHGGHIWFTSQQGQSTTFYLSLPLLPSGHWGYEV